MYIRITLTLTLAKGLLLSKMYEHVMKALRNLALALMVPVLASSLSAAEKPEILLAFADQLLAEHEKNRQLSGGSRRRQRCA